MFRYLARLCRLERQLFATFFHSPSAATVDAAALEDTSFSSSLSSSALSLSTVKGGGGTGASGSSSGSSSGGGGGGSGEGALAAMLAELCLSLYGAARPFLIQQNDLDALCQVTKKKLT